MFSSIIIPMVRYNSYLCNVDNLLKCLVASYSLLQLKSSDLSKGFDGVPVFQVYLCFLLAYFSLEI